MYKYYVSILIILFCNIKVPPHLCGSMCNVILPSTDGHAVSYMQKQLDQKHNVYVVYSSVTDRYSTTNKIYFLRLSAAVYLELSDYIRLIDIVPALLAEAYSAT